MKRITSVEIHNYIRALLYNPQIKKIIHEWEIEPKLLIQAISNDLFSLGIYDVSPTQHKEVILKSMKVQLFNNPRIRARQAELRQLAKDQNDRRSRRLQALKDA